MADTPYIPTVWQNGQAGLTPLDATRLNKLENAVAALSINKVNSTQVQNMINASAQASMLNN